MNKALKWGFIICASLVVIIIAAILIIPRVVDVQKYKPELEKKVAEASGRRVVEAGDGGDDDEPKEDPLREGARARLLVRITPWVFHWV